MRPPDPMAITRFLARARQIPSEWKARRPRLHDDEIRAVAGLIEDAVRPLVEHEQATGGAAS